MKVLILEDVIEHQVRLERILDEISKESNIPISYKTTGKVREFEEYIENDEVNQLYFLDIDIHGIEKKGLEDGDYYMVVTLPSDLSEKTTTLSNIQSTAAYQSLTSEQQTEISDSVSQNLTDSIQSAQSIVALVQDLQGSLENLQNQSNQVSPITSTSLIGLSSGLTEIQGDVTSKLVPASQSIASGVNAYTTGVDKVSQDVIQRAVGLG